MYKELSSDDESFPSLFTPDLPTAAKPSRSPSNDDDEFTPGSTAGATARKAPPKKRKQKDPDKPVKPRKPRVPKNPTDSPSKTHVNRFKQNLGGGDMIRTVSENPLAGGGASAMARVYYFLTIKADLVTF